MLERGRGGPRPLLRAPQGGGRHVLNICDQPVNLLRSYGRLLGRDCGDWEPTYFGLNHFGWFTHLYDKDGTDLVPLVKEYVRENGFLPSDAEERDQSWLDTYAMVRDMVQLVSTAVPLPGGTGGAEGGFALFFGGMFGSKATAGFLVWRLCSFIGPTLFAVPFLGMRSDRTESIYHEVNRKLAAHKARKASGGKRSKQPTGIKLPTSKLRQQRSGKSSGIKAKTPSNKK